MRNLLAFFMALFLTLAGLGWYLGWYQVRTAPNREGHTTVNIDINTVKVSEDTAKTAAHITEMLEKTAKEQKEKADKAAADKNTPKDQTKPEGGWFTN